MPISSRSAQFLPGPASSQVGMAIGLRRAGFAGMLAAWVAFTLPSAILLVAFAWGASAIDPEAGGWIEGLKAAAVAVVAQAVLAMASSLAPDRERAPVAVAAMIVAMLLPTASGQVLAIAAGGLAGLVWLRPSLPQISRHEALAVPVGKPTAVAFLAIFAVLLVALPLLVSWTANPVIAMIDSFYRTGSLVFGGGHVVLPLLEAEVVETGRVGEAGLSRWLWRGAGRARPALRLRRLSRRRTTSALPPASLGAAIALLAIYLPSVLLVVGAAALLGRSAFGAARPARAARRQRRQWLACWRRRSTIPSSPPASPPAGLWRSPPPLLSRWPAWKSAALGGRRGGGRLPASSSCICFLGRHLEFRAAIGCSTRNPWSLGCLCLLRTG